MKVDADFVRHVAGLARLDMPADRAERFAAELSRILDYVEQIGDVEVAEVGSTDPLPRRADTPQHDVDPRALLRESAGHVGEFVQVPPVVGGDE